VSLALCAVVLLIPGRWRVWVNWALVAGAVSLLFADLLYVRYFNDMLSLAVLRSSGQTGDVWDSVVGLLQRSDLWWFVNLPCGVLLARAVTSLPEAPRLSRWRQRAIGFACVVVAIAVGQPVGASGLLHDPTLKKFFRNLAVVERVGPLGFHTLDVWQDVENDWLRPALTPAELAETRQWFAARAGSRAGAGPAFGAARGMNIIAIQVESFQRFVVGLQVNGQEITPNLNRWTRDALWFSHTTDQTSEGRSSDAEFITMTSLLPLEHGAVAFRYGSNHYVGLPAVLADHGYSTLSAVPLEGSFWNSRVTHQQYGITNNLFRSDFTIGEQVGWGLNDRDFFREMMPRMRAARQPFFAWLLTLSLHHPFDGFPDDLRVLKLGDLERTPFGNYLEGLHFFDAALGDLEAQLQSAGLLDRTIIVIYGDHDAGFGWDGGLAPYIGHARTAVEWVEQDAVPLFIRVPGHSELAGEQATPAGLTDVPPTLLALVGIDPSGLPYVGRNLLGNPGDEPLVRPYGSWIDRRHVFLQQGQGRDRCGDAASGQVGPAANCQAANQAALKELEISRRVIAYDLQTKLAAQALSASGSTGPASWAHKRR
jgi:phosphoglycerol transferase MdoB-like AlkP superfamily enzyme